MSCRGRPSPAVLGLLALVGAGTAVSPAEDPDSLPVRGLHVGVPGKGELGDFTTFIRQILPREGVNTLVVEFGYRFDFRSRPEFSDGSAPGKSEAAEIARACREAGVELIPQINCLGHQSWAGSNGRLLQKHPEFDETPGKFPGNKGIYCRSYCPLHPEVHKVLFDLIDELAEACGARSFHVGMDEVFLLADPDCPRCRGKDPAELFAGEVKLLHEHLEGKGRRMWMWGDRFLDGKATKIGKWEASENGTHPAVDRVPKDIVICDWHYEKAHETPRFFAEKGFGVVACPWRKVPVALGSLALVRSLRSGGNRRALGVVQTTWCGFGAFQRAYRALEEGGDPGKGNAPEAARCFRELFRQIRETK